MKSSILLLLLFICFPTTYAQGVTTHDDSKNEKKGVFVFQDSELDEVVNNTMTGKELLDNWKENAQKSNSKSGKIHKARGYRIQVYTGGNSRENRLQASRIENQFKTKFPELGVYREFISPRWICRIGDFKTYEEAAEYLTKVNEKRISKEARIVKCVIYVRE